MVTHFLLKSLSDRVSSQASRPLSTDPAPVTDLHLDAAVGWLTRSIEACGGRASSKGYRFMKGWMPPYAETSGYIIPTLMALSAARSEPDLAETAATIGRWLVEVQLDNGGFSGYEMGVQHAPDVFDTGMILLGFNALIHSGKAEFVVPARRAAGFLVASMDDQGCFVRNMSHDMLHTYNVRSAWALMAFASLVGDSSLMSHAADCARWTVSRQNEHGFYLDNAFKPGGNANTHGTAYVMRGLLMLHGLSGDPASMASVRMAADRVCDLYEREGWIAAELSPTWEYLSSHVCLTGYAQLSIVLYRLFVINADARYRRIADRLLADVARRQSLGTPGAPWHGGIAGSFPIYGRYAPLQYPNWATKFFIDAILAQRHVAAGGKAWPEIDRYAG